MVSKTPVGDMVGHHTILDYTWGLMAVLIDICVSEVGHVGHIQEVVDPRLPQMSVPDERGPTLDDGHTAHLAKILKQ